MELAYALVKFEPQEGLNAGVYRCVYALNNVHFGDLIRGTDGYYLFFATFGFGGYPSTLLFELSMKLNELNADWDAEIQALHEKEKESAEKVNIPPGTDPLQGKRISGVDRELGLKIVERRIRYEGINPDNPAIDIAMAILRDALFTIDEMQEEITRLKKMNTEDRDD